MSKRETTAQYAYRSALNSAINPCGTCVGTNLGVACGNYGALRGTVKCDIKDPTLIQRSSLNGGCAPGPLNTIEDTLDKPIYQKQQLDLQSMHSRYCEYPDINEVGTSKYMLTVGDQWSDGYHGRYALHDSRMHDLCAEDYKYTATKCSATSQGSFGSYGV